MRNGTDAMVSERTAVLWNVLPLSGGSVLGFQGIC